MYDIEMNMNPLNYSFNNEIFFDSYVYDAILKEFIPNDIREKIFDNVEKLIPYNSEEIITDKIQSLIQELTPTMPNNVKELIPANKDIQITIEPPSNTFKYDTKKNSFKNKTVIAQKPSSPDGFVANYEALFANDQDKSEIKNSNNSTSYKSDDYDDFTEDAERIEYKKKKLFKIIDDAKKKIDNNLYIVSAKYDIIYFRYNRFTLLILIISTLSTFIEAFRLTVVNFYNDNPDKIPSFLNLNQVSLIINIISLILGTLLTILSSMIKFRNYRENLEKLKNSQQTLFNYRGLFNKQKEQLDFYDITKKLDMKLFIELENKLEEYNKEVREVNIFENIRIKDTVKFTSIKVDHDLELAKLASKREIGMLKLTASTESQKEKIKNKMNSTKINANLCYKV
jgi:hypothetical protein